MLRKGIVFSQVGKNVYMIENDDNCISVLFIDDLFALTVPDSCNKEIELSSLIYQLRSYYSYETGVHSNGSDIGGVDE